MKHNPLATDHPASGFFIFGSSGIRVVILFYQELVIL